MIDAYVFLTPLLLLPIVALLAFVGCVNIPPFPQPEFIEFAGVRVDLVQTMPATFVQATFAGAVTEGSLLVVWIWYRTSTGQTVASVTDSAGNTYVAADALAAGAGTLAAIRQQVWYAADAKPGGGAPITITATFSGAVEPNIGLGVFEYAHADRTAPLVVTAQARGLGAEARTGAVNTLGAHMLFGAAVFSGGGTNDPTFILRLLQQGNVAEDYLAVPVPNEIVCATTPPGSQADWIAQMVAFRLPGPP